MYNHKVLFVDDEPGITQSIQRALRKEPYEILTANSAEEGLEILRRDIVSVVVCDEKMPKVSGSEFLSIVRSDFPGIVRILFTGYASLETATRALNAGEVFRLLKKPCNEIDLAIAVRQGLQHRDLIVRCSALLTVFRLLCSRVEKDSLLALEIERIRESALAGNCSSLNIQELIDDMEVALRICNLRCENVELKS